METLLALMLLFAAVVLVSHRLFDREPVCPCCGRSATFDGEAETCSACAFDFAASSY